MRYHYLSLKFYVSGSTWFHFFEINYVSRLKLLNQSQSLVKQTRTLDVWS